MKRGSLLPRRAAFFWAFISNRWKLDKKRTRVLPPEYVPTVSVVIPALNEAENLPHVVPLIPFWVDEVLLVDGYSIDGTVEMARQLRPDIWIVEQEGRGKGAALRSGFQAAHGDIIIMLDADGSTDPGEIPAFVSALLAGADFAKGSRFVQGGGTADMPWYRRWGNGVFVRLVRLLFGGAYSDLCYGYNAFWADVLPALRLDGDGFEIETIMNVRALRAGLKVVEVPSFEDKRIYGEGRLKTIPDGWRVLKTIFREWLTPPQPTAGRLLAEARSKRIRASVAELPTVPQVAEIGPS
jgi:glycosyltransferase involved in cell wall biosynthesis